MPEDIRNASADEYWQQFETKWTNLLTYRYLGRTHPVLDQGASTVSQTMPLRFDMRNAIGGVMAAPLVISSPEGGGYAEDTCVPNPMTQSLHILDDGRGVTQVDGIQEAIRVGRTVGFSRSRIVDSHNPSRIIAISEGTCVSLAPAPPGFEKVENPMLEIVDSPSLPPLHQVFGARRRAEGIWVLPELTAETASPDAALHLGPIQIVLETAATELAQARAGTDRLQIKSWHVMYTARGKVGPFRTTGEAFSGQDGGVGCFLSLHDEGNEDRVVASASAAFVRVG
ncbi:MAG: hypothetical protein JWL70_9 [Acidimicrobiia bacterium]|nr:hypothetical protein [Acidimicrobiia bacterium]